MAPACQTCRAPLAVNERKPIDDKSHEFPLTSSPVSYILFPTIIRYLLSQRGNIHVRKPILYHTIGIISASPTFLERAAQEIAAAIEVPLARLSVVNQRAFTIRYE